MVANTSKDHRSDQVVSQASPRSRTGQWRKGHTGNPHGRLGKASIAAREAKKAELLDAIVKDLGGHLNPIEAAFAEQAARMLSRAATSADDSESCRLTNSAGKVLDRIKASVAARCTGPRESAFDLYIKSKRGTP